MPSSSAIAIDAARSMQRHFVQTASAFLETKGSGVPRMMAGGFPNYLELAYGQTLMRHAEQYTHFTGWTYCVISRIATRLAGQKVKMGRKAKEPTVDSWEWDRTPGRRLSVVDKLHAPAYVKSIDTDIEMIEDHPLLTAVQRPNNVMTNWSLIYITVASMELTGKAYWWFIEEDDGSLSIWPLPSDWVTPVHSDNMLFERYRIRPRGQFGVQEIVDGKDIAYFYLPDPGNPVGAVSPVQTQAPAVAIDEEIQSSQYRYFKNGIFPGMKITTGRLPSMTGVGEGPRPILTPDQRREIREAARALWQGSVNFNEPFIVDGLIEDIQRITQTGEEMAFIDSANFNKGRILQAFGVNPYILGEVTGVNKAQAVVAESNFNINVLSPIASMIGEKMSAHIGDDSIIFWIELPETSDPDQKLRNWSACLPFGVVKKGEYRQQILGIPPAGDETDEEYISSGGGYGAPGGFGAPGLPKPNGDGEKPAGTQGTPASQAEGRGDGSDSERNRLAMEAGDVPPSTPPHDDEAIPVSGTSFEPGWAKANAKRFPKTADYVRQRLKGGAGSGNFGHAGRPGEVGGSSQNGGSSGGGEGTSTPTTPPASKPSSVQASKPKPPEVSKPEPKRTFEKKLPQPHDEFATKVSSNQSSDIASNAAKHKMTPEAYKEAVANHLKTITESSVVKPHIRISSDILGNQILDDGRFKSQFEIKGRELYIKGRTETESNVLGVASNSSKVDRPIYGFMSSQPGGGVLETESEVAMYGDAVVRLKDSVRDRTTITGGDSLNETDLGKTATMRAVPLNAPTIEGFRASSDPLSYRTERDVPDYLEAHFHGGVKVGDIDRVFFKSEPKPWLRDRLNSKGIKWEVQRG